MLVLRRERDERTDGTVDMEPQPLALTERSDGIEIVRGTGIDRGRIANYSKRLFARSPVSRDQLRERGHVYFVISVDSHIQQRRGTEPQ